MPVGVNLQKKTKKHGGNKFSEYKHFSFGIWYLFILLY